MKKQSRKKPDITFNESGYVNGWFMAVGKCYRDQLDIKLTNIVRSKNKKFTHLSDEDFTDRLKKEIMIHDFYITHQEQTKKWKIRAWTQGRNFCFERGHIIYKSCNETTETFSLQIDSARAANPTIGDDGEVVFIVHYCPRGKKYAATTLGMGTLSQIKFVEFLKNGLPEIKPIAGYDAAGRFHNTNISILHNMGGLCLQKR